MENKENNNNKNNKKKKTIIILITILIVGILSYLAYQHFFNEDENIGIEIDKDAEDNIQDELNEKVEASMMNISMNLSPVFENGTSEGNLLIVNEEVNNHMQVIEIFRDDTDELIYKSGAIPVGSKIETTKLDVNLPKGTYDCTAYFNSIDDETGESIGKAGANIKLTIQN